MMSLSVEQAGLTIVSVDPDRALIAFREEGALEGFQAAIATYDAGPRPGKKTTKWDVFEFIEPDQIATLSPPDRVGPRLAIQIGASAERIDPSGRCVVEVELWHPGNRLAARTLLGELRELIATDPTANDRKFSRVADEYVGETLCLAKAILSGPTLVRVLAARIVAEVDLPPTPVFNPADARMARTGAFLLLPSSRRHGGSCLRGGQRNRNRASTPFTLRWLC